MAQRVNGLHAHPQAGPAPITSEAALALTREVLSVPMSDLLHQQAVAGDIALLFGDEAEASAYPYLAHAWAERGADLRVSAPCQARKRALFGVLDYGSKRTDRACQHQQTQRRLYGFAGNV